MLARFLAVVTIIGACLANPTISDTFTTDVTIESSTQNLQGTFSEKPYGSDGGCLAAERYTTPFAIDVIFRNDQLTQYTYLPSLSHCSVDAVNDTTTGCFGPMFAALAYANATGATCENNGKEYSLVPPDSGDSFTFCVTDDGTPVKFTIVDRSSATGSTNVTFSNWETTVKDADFDVPSACTQQSLKGMHVAFTSPKPSLKKKH
eukprot:NODE_4914_length_740_cov_72.370310_g4891_i0.p1 GENE.NODE_4914_length_740_cov_72.370310_g4891_i0~~NODE_4914_length_740_cov_72.370310_g4891_i0.p1  ORF type:complete len:205 (+),score=46.07 NODE_4914_length_740_cov_72.370310_g4891_i0:61-675(+)